MNAHKSNLPLIYMISGPNAITTLINRACHQFCRHRLLHLWWFPFIFFIKNINLHNGSLLYFHCVPGTFRRFSYERSKPRTKGYQIWMVRRSHRRVSVSAGCRLCIFLHPELLARCSLYVFFHGRHNLHVRGTALEISGHLIRQADDSAVRPTGRINSFNCDPAAEISGANHQPMAAAVFDTSFFYAGHYHLEHHLQ